MTFEDSCTSPVPLPLFTVIPDPISLPFVPGGLYQFRTSFYP